MMLDWRATYMNHTAQDQRGTHRPLGKTNSSSRAKTSPPRTFLMPNGTNHSGLATRKASSPVSVKPSGVVTRTTATRRPIQSLCLRQSITAAVALYATTRKRPQPKSAQSDTWVVWVSVNRSIAMYTASARAVVATQAIQANASQGPRRLVFAVSVAARP